MQTVIPHHNIQGIQPALRPQRMVGPRGYSISLLKNMYIYCCYSTALVLLISDYPFCHVSIVKNASTFSLLLSLDSKLL